MKNKKAAFLLLIILIFSTALTGCNTIENIQLKLGLKNKDFEFMKQNKVDKIVIESTRGPGFRFVVTDKVTIKELYDFLSSAKIAKKTTKLQPDYVFEMHIGSDVKKFNYVVGVDEKGVGNFYDDKKSYIVSKRLDNDIIQNLSFIRKPREFDKVYYPSILDVLQKDKDSLNKDDKKVGIDINSDVECAQYILSVDLEDFKRNLKKIIPNASIINHDREKYNVIVTIKNQGYTTSMYKTLITIDDKKEKINTNYYVTAKYNVNNWNIVVNDKKPDNW